jgi:hypothetical protein
MRLSTGTEIAEHRLHCSEAETLVVPSSPLTDVEYNEYCLFLHNMNPEQRGAWMGHRLPPVTPPPAAPMSKTQFEEYCDLARVDRLERSVTQRQESAA